MTEQWGVRNDWGLVEIELDYLHSKIEHLQAQLDEAVKIVQMYQSEESNEESLAFLRKWGYKNDVDG